MNQLVKQQKSVGLAQITNATSKEMSIFNASKNLPKIKDYSTKQELAYVNSLIVKWSILLGIKTPDGNEVNIIANHIKDNHPSFNAIDIQEAINLCVTDSLNVDVEHYGVLSAHYVSKVFKAYHVYKGTVMSKIRNEIEKQEREKIKPPSEEERINDFLKLLKHAKATVESKSQYYDFGDVLFTFFWKNNLVANPIPEALQKEALKYGEKMFKTQAKKRALKDVINGVNFNHSDRKKTIIEYAKTYTVNEWLKVANVKEIEKKITFEMVNK